MTDEARRCLICGTDISDKRSQAIYCGNRCAKRASRAGVAPGRHELQPSERVDPVKKPGRLRAPSRDDIAALLLELVSLEQAFRFAAGRAEYRFRPLCTRIADTIAGLLDSEEVR